MALYSFGGVSTTATAPRRRLRGTVLLLQLAAAVLVAVLGFSAQAVSGNEQLSLFPGAARDTAYSVPDTLTVLKDETFDGYVFAKRERPQSWFIFVYSPWCEHCKGLMPQFINASLLLENEIKQPHARLAVLNAQANPKMTDRFHIAAFPTLLYTTGRGKNWHRFDGGHSADSFIEFAVYLQRAVDAGSFADDVTAVRSFAAVEAESGGFRVPFYVYVPSTSSSTRENQREALWPVAIDGASSIGNVRFGVIYERDLDAAWREEGGSSFVEVVETAQQCAQNGFATGPAGEVLVSCSDRFRAPQCFSGPWLTSGNGTVTSGKTVFEEPQQLSPLLERYITVNGFRAVEELNTGMFSVLSKQSLNYLGLVVVDGGLEQSDRMMLPVLREMARAATDRTAGMATEAALQQPMVTWAYIDGTMYDFWRVRYSIKAAEMPAVLLVDPVRNRMFRARTRIPDFEAIKRDVPWAVDGPQHKMLQQFVDDVMADKFWGEKMSLMGFFAERLSYFSVTGWVYKTVGYDDFTFLAICFALSFFSFILFIALFAEPWLERKLERERFEEEEAAKRSKKKTQ